MLQVRGPVQAIRIRLHGESPLRYFSAAPTIRITASGRVIAQFHPTSDFRWDVVVPADAVAASGGDIAIETDRVFVPAETERSVDTRRLGLRIWDCGVEPVKGSASSFAENVLASYSGTAVNTRRSPAYTCQERPERQAACHRPFPSALHSLDDRRRRKPAD